LDETCPLLLKIISLTSIAPSFQRHKLPGRDCVVISDSEENANGNGNGNGKEEESATTDGQKAEDLRGCLMRSYLAEIERRCNCSMTEAFGQKSGKENSIKFIGTFTYLAFILFGFQISIHPRIIPIHSRNAMCMNILNVFSPSLNGPSTGDL
jgi:hypothetical protein